MSSQIRGLTTHTRLRSLALAPRNRAPLRAGHVVCRTGNAVRECDTIRAMSVDEGLHVSRKRRALRAVRVCEPLAKPASVPVWLMGGFRCTKAGRLESGVGIRPRKAAGLANACISGFRATPQFSASVGRATKSSRPSASPCRKSRASEIHPLDEPPRLHFYEYNDFGDYWISA